MLKVGLIGIGFMGRTHLHNYLRLQKEGYPVQVTAICDIDEKKFQGVFTEGNIQLPGTDIDFSPYRLYADFDRMLEEAVFLKPYSFADYRETITELKKVPDMNVFLKDQSLAMYAYLSSLVYLLPEDLKKLNWDMVPLPSFNGQPGVGSQSYPFYFGITKLSQNQDEAMEVLKYMISEEFQTELAQKGIMPVLKNEAVQKQLGQNSPFKDKNFQAVFQNKFAPIPPKALYDAGIVNIYAKYADQVMKQTTDLNTALRMAEEEAAKYIADYKKK